MQHGDLEKMGERSQRGDSATVLTHVGLVDCTVQGGLVRVDLEDRPPRVIGAFSVHLGTQYVTMLAIPPQDLLYVLVRDPMELKEELPSLHVRLHQL